MKTKNSTPSSEWENEDKCPNCGTACDINEDLDDDFSCNDCRIDIEDLS
jgi:predicted  nucleic acid-binding Zn ribbon protein